MGHLPTKVAPDLRNRSYRIEAEVRLAEGDAGVLIAHGDATTGYSLYLDLEDGRLVHDMNIGGEHVMVRSERPVPAVRAASAIASRVTALASLSRS
jgi:arylsulfatase